MNWYCHFVFSIIKQTLYIRGQHIFFCKEPEYQYFRLFGPLLSVTYNFCFIFCNPLKNLKPILSSRNLQKQATGWIWPLVQSVLTLGLDDFISTVRFTYFNMENLWHIFMFDIYDTHFPQVALEQLYQFKWALLGG